MGRNDRDVIGAWETVVLAAATYRLWRLASDDKILDRPRDAVLGRSPEWVEELVECPWCLGAHLSLGVYLLWVWKPKETLIACAPLAISSGVGALAKLLD